MAGPTMRNVQMLLQRSYGAAELVYLRGNPEFIAAVQAIGDSTHSIAEFARLCELGDRILERAGRRPKPPEEHRRTA